MVNKRHFDLFLKAKNSFTRCIGSINEKMTLEIYAENLKDVYVSLSNIVGRSASDDLINKIFSDFCIGK